MNLVWQKDHSNYWRLQARKLNGWLYSVVVGVMLAGGLYACKALGILDMSPTRVFCYAMVFAMGHRLGWYRMER